MAAEKMAMVASVGCQVRRCSNRNALLELFGRVTQQQKNGRARSRAVDSLGRGGLTSELSH